MRGSQNVRQYAAILWTLKLDGDVNENHQNGNATVVLRERVMRRASGILSEEDFANRFIYMKKVGMVYTMPKGGKRPAKVIRLAGEFDENEYPNPFPEEVYRPELVERTTNLPVPAEGSLMNGQREWPIKKRLQLIAELSRSIDEDMDKVRAAL